MSISVGMVTVVVPSYGAGLDFFVRGLGLALLKDTDLGGGKRWVVVGGAGGARLLLAEATTPEQRAAIGNQAGGRVGFFVMTDDFAADHARLTAAGVRFLEPPRYESYGTVAVFADPFGNTWDLIQPTETSA
ncbi:MAG: VOC family protein [Devosia sp.]